MERFGKNNFNSHAHVERDLEYSDSRGQTGNFNSHAHVERDSVTNLRSKIIWISTHTLTWSVTGVPSDKAFDYIISTHTLTWSVTTTGSCSRLDLLNFNSHAHVERDRLLSGPCDPGNNFNSHAHVERDQHVKLAQTNINISTHTLTWSVTPSYGVTVYEYFISTHTLTWSVTCINLAFNLAVLFQLTRSRGA